MGYADDRFVLCLNGDGHFFVVSLLLGVPAISWVVQVAGRCLSQVIYHLQVNVQRRSLAQIASTLQRARARVKIVGCIRFCGDRDGRTMVRSYGTKKLVPIA